MTIDELRKEAKLLGYDLIPHNKREKFIPCTCGCNRRTRWFIYRGGEDFIRLECMKCGKSVEGRTEAEARRNWNDMIKKEKEEMLRSYSSISSDNYEHDK